MHLINSGSYWNVESKNTAFSLCVVLILLYLDYSFTEGGEYGPAKDRNVFKRIKERKESYAGTAGGTLWCV